MKKIISALLAVSVASLTLTSALAEEAGVVNGDFSDGLNGWDIVSSSASSSAVTAEDGVLRAATPFILQQSVNIENGTYDLTAELTNSDASQNAYLYAKTNDAVIARTAVPKYDTLTRVTVRGIKVTDNHVNIGINAPNGMITMDNVTLTPASDKETEFLKGGEISKLTYVEDMGGRFYDADGNERDALQIMAENGFNLARIRVLNNPGKGRGDGTYYLPEGYQDEADCLELARRAKSKGMKIQFSFAYSDYWSDGAQQYIPHEWQEYINENNITDKQALADYLSEQVYEYTKKVMNDLIAQDTAPEYVSIGNEMQYGILFGGWQNNNGLYNTAGSAYQVQILNAGAKAVRETSPASRIILHTDNGGKVISSRGLFYNTFLSQVDCDIIGVSYYPYYNSGVSIDTVVNEFNTMISKYDKDVIIMETGYNWAESRGDGYEGQLKDSGYYQNIYGETKEGQHAFLTELYAKLKTNVTDGRCLGDLYWDPVMIYDGGSYKIGWAVKESDDWADGNVVSNSTIFDFEGKALPSQEAMKYNTAQNSDIIIGGRTNSPNTALEFTVNQTPYSVNTDKFGEYILSVPYTDKLNISLAGYDNVYSIDAPENDFMLRNVDFPASSFSYSASSGKITLPYLDRNARVIAAFYKNGVMTKAESFDVSAQTRSINVSPLNDADEAKVFLWDSINGMTPLSNEAQILDITG